MTVAWQRGTSLGSGIQQVEYKPIVGLASGSLDGDFLRRFIDVMGKPQIRPHLLEISKILEAEMHWRFKETPTKIGMRWDYGDYDYV
jgi:hypothetical protein